jgi:DNA-binding NtrC family response regulator
LLGHDWPGNVRELKNVVETVTLLRAGRQVRSVDLPESIRQRSSAVAAVDSGPASATIALDLNDGLEALIQQIVETALTLDRGSSTKAATRLGISPRTVQRYVASGRVRAKDSPPLAEEAER